MAFSAVNVDMMVVDCSVNDCKYVRQLCSTLSLVGVLYVSSLILCPVLVASLTVKYMLLTYARSCSLSICGT